MKKSTEQWFSEYVKTHQNPLNQRIHMIAVPLIFWSIVALLCVLPPATLLIMIPVLLFYFSLSWQIGVAMTLMTGISIASSLLIKSNGGPLLAIALAVFVLAWIAQFYGHKVEGKKPSFFNDILFLLIGPLWTLRKIHVLR